MYIYHYKLLPHECMADRHVAAFDKKLPNEQAMEIRRWCWEAFGWEGYDVNTDTTRWKAEFKHGQIIFEREEDLTFFLLRWA